MSPHCADMNQRHKSSSKELLIINMVKLPHVCPRQHASPRTVEVTRTCLHGLRGADYVGGCQHSMHLEVHRFVQDVKDNHDEAATAAQEALKLCQWVRTWHCVWPDPEQQVLVVFTCFLLHDALFGSNSQVPAWDRKPQPSCLPLPRLFGSRKASSNDVEIPVRAPWPAHRSVPIRKPARPR